VSRKPTAASRKPSAATKAAANVKGALKGAVVAFTRRLPGSGGVMDAITLLETDHRRLEDLLKRGEDTTERAERERKALLDTIAQELTIHETIEERVLYPALKAYPEARDIVLEGFQEHHVADLIMKELFDTAVTDEAWGAKFKVFQENIEHHIKEEEGPMFRTARGVMSREELLQLGAKMAQMKTAAEKGRL
jgi:hemerythrin-like domain-containing protein